MSANPFLSEINRGAKDRAERIERLNDEIVRFIKHWQPQDSDGSAEFSGEFVTLVQRIYLVAAENNAAAVAEAMKPGEQTFGFKRRE